MEEKRRVHPTIDKVTHEILFKLGIKPSEALEEYACHKVTNKHELVIEEKILKEREQELLDDKQAIEERLEKVQDKLTAIKQLKQDFNPANSREFDETVEIVKQMLTATKGQLEEGKWNVPRTTIPDIAKLCKKRSMRMEAVLSEVPGELKQYLEGYEL